MFPIPDARFNGYTSRRATHLKKIGMCLSASRGSDLIIHKEDLDRSLKLLEITERKMSSTFRGMGTSNLADVIDKISENMLDIAESGSFDVSEYLSEEVLF